MLTRSLAKSSPDDGAARLGRRCRRSRPARRRRRRRAQPRQCVQAPPAIRVVAAEKRELVETLSVNGTIVAREEADAGTDLNGMIVIRSMPTMGDVVKKGDVLAVLDRSTLDTQLAQSEASRAQAEANIAQMRAQIGDAEVAVRQAGEGAGARQTPCRRRASPPRRSSTMRSTPPTARRPSWNRRKRRSPLASRRSSASSTRRRTSICIQIDKTEVRAPADGLVLARNATLGGVVIGRRRTAVPASPSTPNSSLPPTSPKRRCRGLPKACRRRSALPAADSGIDGHDPPDFARGRPGLAARRDPHRAAVRARPRAPAISRAARSRPCGAKASPCRPRR